MWYYVSYHSEHSADSPVEVHRGEWASVWNEDGLTAQMLTGAYGFLNGPFSTEQEAAVQRRNYLRCDAAEKGVYCYTHNRI